MSSSPQRVLLTGGAGFIGSHVSEALLRRQAQLSIVDNLADFYSLEWKKSNLEEVRRAGIFDFYNVNICEFKPLRELVARIKPEVIIHLAVPPVCVRPSNNRAYSKASMWPVL
jgi:UDP-glucuronate 4-epimerase